MPTKDPLPQPPAIEKITFTPMLTGDFAPEPPTRLNSHRLVVKVYGLTEDGRPRHPLVPARTFRDMETKLLASIPHDVLVSVTTPEAIHRLGVECYGYKIGEDGELLITLLSARHESINLTHGQNLATLSFINLRMVD